MADEAKAAAAVTARPPEKRVKVPTVLQMEAVECGAAALAMILGYHGRIVPLEELRGECGVSRDGSKANNMLKAARKYGMVAKGFKTDLEALYKQTFPAIIFWNLNHWVVLEGFRKGKAHIADPAQGPRVIAPDELDSAYSGILLTFEPGPSFKPGGEKPSMLAALRRRLTGSESALLFVVLCGLFLVLPGLVVPTFARVFIDEYLVSGREAIVKPLLFGIALTAALRMLLTWLQEYFLLRLETKLALITSSQFFDHILRLPVSYFSQRFAGEIGSRVEINDKVAGLVSGRLATTLINCVLAVFYAGLMLLYSVPLTLIVVAIALFNIVALRFVSRTRIDASRRLLQDKGKLMGTAMNGLRMIETLKATGSESEYFARWAGYQAKALSSEQQLGQLSELVSSVPPLVNTFATMTVLVLGGLKVMHGDMTVGMLVAYQTLLASFIGPLNSFISFGSAIQELEADMNRLDDVLNYPKDTLHADAPPAAAKAGSKGAPLEGAVKLQGKVELRNVTFGYSPLEPPLIEDFSLTIEPGQRVALVGPSGSGKSTVSRLVAGLYAPWQGQILFDGVPRAELPRSLIVNSVGMVDQEVFLFAGTVADNVTMWDSTIPVVHVAAACRDASIDGVIETRPGTYQSAVDEGGTNFSGGERQRLEIGRALVGAPTVMILDEATSALDPTTEVAVDRALRRRGCTCIIVAHRLSTIRDADEIIVLDHGKVVQRGTHDDLKESEGLYRQLISA